MSLQRVAHLRKLRRLRRGRAGWKIREIAEPAPTMQTVRCERIQQRMLLGDLGVELLHVPVAAAGANQVHTGGCHLRKPVPAARRRTCTRRPIRQANRKRQHPAKSDKAATLQASMQRP